MVACRSSPPTKTHWKRVIARLSTSFLPHRQFGFSPREACAAARVLSRSAAGPVPGSGSRARLPVRCVASRWASRRRGRSTARAQPAPPCHPPLSMPVS